MGGKKIKMGGKRVCWCEEVQISESEVRRRRWKFRGVVFCEFTSSFLLFIFGVALSGEIAMTEWKLGPRAGRRVSD